MFASLQSDKGQQLLKERKIENNLDSMVCDMVSFSDGSNVLTVLLLLWVVRSSLVYAVGGYWCDTVGMVARRS